MRSLILVVACCLAAIGVFGATPAPAPGHYLRELYFYQVENNQSFLHLFDPDQIVKDATTNFPRTDEMSGIAIDLYWAQLCPKQGACNYPIIDRILDYWGKAGKMVVLCVATTGPPLELVSGDQRTFVSATPDWVLHEVTTYQSDSNNFLGVYRDWRDMASNPQYRFTFPRYDDPKFVDDVRRLVRDLAARYDGNSAISYMRIATGKAGEDNPYGRNDPSWFTDHLWIQFSRQVADEYLADFHKTRLEFDVLWTAIVAAGAKTATPFAAADQTEAQQFIDYVESKNVFISFDGIAPAPGKNTVPGATAAVPAGTCDGYDPQPDPSTSAIAAAPLAQIERLKDRGIPFGLEGNALSDPCMAPDRVAAVLDRYRPKRFVFFGDVAAVINFQQNGLTEQNRYEVDALTNMFIPWATQSDFAAHEAEAMPKIIDFADTMEQLVRDRMAAGNTP